MYFFNKRKNFYKKANYDKCNPKHKIILKHCFMIKIQTLHDKTNYILKADSQISKNPFKIPL